MAEPTAGQPASLDAVVRGWVQGVGFRYFVLDRATALGLVGWVANEPDGSVRCVAEGPRTDLETLLAALTEGPLGRSGRRRPGHLGPGPRDLRAVHGPGRRPLRRLRACV